MYNVVINDWGETTYVPTTPGKILLVLLLIMALAAAVVFAKKYAKKQNPAETDVKNSMLTVKQLTFCAMAIALGTILSNIKLFHFPTGGSITLLSMLIICLPGYFFGLAAGLLTGVAYGILQLIIDPYVLYPMQLVVDYFLAFGALGLSGLFCNAKHGLLKGYITAVLGRYIFAVISGWIFFGSYAWEGWGALPYSLAYNGIYIFAEAIITVIILAIPAVSKALARVKQTTLS
ncbi:MAG: energy-coupled thiamine transporter ThiT [Lachnospiraceae bacterium]